MCIRDSNENNCDRVAYLCASVSRPFTVKTVFYHKFTWHFPEFYGLEVHLLLNLRRPIICGVSGFRQFSKQLHEQFVPPFCLFWKFHSPVSKLIHLASCVKFNPYLIPGIVLIVVCGTQSNRRTNFIPRLARFNPRLALIVFSGTGAWRISSYLNNGNSVKSHKFSRRIVA